MPMPSGFRAQEQRQERQQAQHDHHHARHTARSRAEHLLRAMAAGKAAVFRARIVGHCPQAARCERRIRDLWRSGARFPRESLAGASEIYASTKKEKITA
jgi:hypothetical protein